MIELSVIIPAYQAEATLERCVQSILTNDAPLEVIIVDDGSADQTPRICRQLSERTPGVVRCYAKNNEGPGAARAYGLQFAAGKYITFVDADDDLLPNAFDRLLPLMDDRTDILEYGYNIVGEDGRVLETHCLKATVYEAESCGLFFAKHEQTTNYLCNKIYRKSIFGNVLFPKLSAGEDAAVLAQAFVYARKYRAAEITAYQYVMTTDSLCRKPFSRRRFDNIAANRFVIEFYQREAPELCVYARQKLCSTIANLYCQCVQSQMELSQKRKCLAELRELYREARHEISYRNLIGIGSWARRCMLFLFDLSPDVCCRLYSSRRCGR